MIKELQRKPSNMQMRREEDHVYEVVCLVMITRCFGMPVKVTNRLDTLGHVETLFRRGASSALWNVVLDVFEALGGASDVTARSGVHLTGLRISVLVVEDKLHEDFILWLLRTLWVAALLVSVNQEDSMLTTPPSTNIGGQMARRIASRSKLSAALNRRIRIMAVNRARSHVNLSLGCAGTLQQWRIWQGGISRKLVGVDDVKSREPRIWLLHHSAEGGLVALGVVPVLCTGRAAKGQKLTSARL
mmetsp:Transcript_25393/g.60466  ORF Transcript_25393/g.60466 Transcript_25393/m.60466 type:complete len:245 (+) Transcript_25393:425-1159(+)